ncbi:MAG TPA: DegQ family serine endoprotease [Chlorobaculum sp.]|uniref:Serine protease n=1 Tax=Chlorobaculum tepidum (strain ATCC 49652 / DSM 12025 / NBRC 103806 / TLS) TaxID=194439 RepID=Q8KCH4_CHLTE|nr:DegQ family serine endoprotease [Chlorobaculum tepidum]AAM72675.1 serine protease [Chlorobaculum tepidum TLS]HBU22663.1 DegQ family serine endoprotease [Chlorobaculum sp.]
MKKKLTMLKSAALVSVGITAGALAFSNLDFSFNGGGNNGFMVSSHPNSSIAAETLRNHPIRTLNDLNDAFVDIAESATPSVVTIYTETEVDRRIMTPFDFFGKSFGEMFDFPLPEEPNVRKEVIHGLGSGVIVSQDGYILTNNHVIDQAGSIAVMTSDNRKFKAKIVGTDPRTDLAVLKISGSGLKPIAFGDSDKLRVGEWVLAIGSPLGENLARTVTQGIVSAKGRVNVGVADYENFIQTDAAINPGNSGGPLVNIGGELVGINTAIASRTGGFEGIGFAVPSNMAYRVYTSLVKNGKVERGYLGVTIQDIDENIAKGLQLKSPEGVLVGTVMQGGPAARAGLKSGDVILEFNGRKVNSAAELRNRIAAMAPGSSAAIRINRDGAILTLNARLESLPDNATASARSTESKNELLGFSVAPLTPELAGRLNLKADSRRIVVTSVSKSSRAFSVGLRPGDVVISVDKKPVDSVAAFNAIVKNKKRGDLLFLLVERGWSRMYFAFNL